MRDDQLLQLITTTIGRPPAYVRDTGLTAWEWRQADQLLFDLSEDSRLEGSLRSVATREYVLVWTAGEVEMTTTVQTNGNGLDQISVRVENGADPDETVDGEIRLEVLYDYMRVTGPVELIDNEQQFVTNADRLTRITLHRGSESSATPWFRPSADTSEGI